MRPYLFPLPWAEFRDAIRRYYRAGKTLRLAELAEQTDGQERIGGLLIATAISGLLYLVICFPALLLLSDTPIRTLFFLDLRTGLPASTQPIDYINALVDVGDASTLLAVLCLYGLIGVVAAVVMVSGGLVRLIIVANGLFWGYGLTAMIHNAWSENPPIELSVLNIAYLFLAYYLAHATTQLLGGPGYAKEKYAHLFSGLNGLFAGWLLSESYGSSALVLSGTLYLICSFVCIFAAERLLLPWVYTAKAWAEANSVDLEWIDDDPNFNALDIARAVAKSWRDDRAEITIAGTIFLLWPGIIAVVISALQFARPT